MELILSVKKEGVALKSADGEAFLIEAVMESDRLYHTLVKEVTTLDSGDLFLYVCDHCGKE